jgi:hypothetical protein
MSTKTLAFDISTTCTGVSLMSGGGGLLEMSHIKLDTPKNIDPEERYLYKADLFREYIQRYKNEGITNIYIEDPLAGSNNVFTANMLIRYNGICSYILYQELGIRPEFMTVHNVRKNLCPELIKTDKKGNQTLSFAKDVDKKHYIWRKVDRWFPGLEWLQDKKGGLKKENFDMSDAVAINVAFALLTGRISYADLIK